MALTAIDFDKLIIDSFDMMTGFDKKTGECDFIFEDIKDGNIENGEETTYLTGKNGTRVGALSRSKTAKLSANNAFFVGGAMASQIGNAPTIASAENKFKVPTYEFIEFAKGATEVTLAQIPVGITGAEIPFIYLAHTDGTQGKKFPIASSASATEFALVPATKKLTLPTGLSTSAGGRIIVFYDYETAVGKKFANEGDKFSKTERIVIDMTLRDACDNSTIYHGKMIFASGKIDGSFTIGVGNEPQAHALSAEAISGNCSSGKNLWDFYIVE